MWIKLSDVIARCSLDSILQFSDKDVAFVFAIVTTHKELVLNISTYNICTFFFSFRSFSIFSFGVCYCYNTLVAILVLKCLRCVNCFSIEILSLIILHNSVKKFSSVPLIVVLKFVKRNCKGRGL